MKCDGHTDNNKTQAPPYERALQVLGRGDTTGTPAPSLARSAANTGDVITTQPTAVVNMGTQTDLAGGPILQQPGRQNAFSVAIHEDNHVVVEYNGNGCSNCLFNTFGHEYDYSRIVKGGIHLAPRPTQTLYRQYFDAAGFGLCIGGCTIAAHYVPVAVGLPEEILPVLVGALGGSALAVRMNPTSLILMYNDTLVANQVMRELERTHPGLLFLPPR